MSKIPEGTQFIEAGCGEKGFRKFEKGCWWFFEGCWRHVDWKMGALTLVTEHPHYVAPATAWTGEGLPPVGRHVHIYDPEGVLMYGAGEDGEVIAHVEDTAVVRMSYGLGCFVAKHLRTAEQIAAEEREFEIQEILRATNGCISRSSASEIYLAGFRKVTP